MPLLPNAVACMSEASRMFSQHHVLCLIMTMWWWTLTPPSLCVGETCVLQPGVMLLQDVFAVKVKRRRAVGQESGGPVLGLALFCCRRRGKRLEEDTLHLHNSSSEHTHHWYNTLKEQIKGNMNILIFKLHILTGHTRQKQPTLRVFHWRYGIENLLKT